MVAGEIGEDADIEFNSVHPLLVQGMGTDLHDARLAVGLEHLRHHLLHFERLGRGPLGRNHPIADFIADGAQETALDSSSLRDGLNHESNGGFAVGAGDADDLQGRAGMLVEGAGRTGQRFANVGHFDLGDAAGNQGAAFADDRAGATLDRRADELMPIDVPASDGHEHHARSHPTRVVGDAGDGLIQRTFHRGGRQDLNKLP